MPNTGAFNIIFLTTHEHTYTWRNSECKGYDFIDFDDDLGVMNVTLLSYEPWLEAELPTQFVDRMSFAVAG